MKCDGKSKHLENFSFRLVIARKVTPNKLLASYTEQFLYWNLKFYRNLVEFIQFVKEKIDNVERSKWNRTQKLYAIAWRRIKWRTICHSSLAQLRTRPYNFQSHEIIRKNSPNVYPHLKVFRGLRIQIIFVNLNFDRRFSFAIWFVLEI